MRDWYLQSWTKYNESGLLISNLAAINDYIFVHFELVEVHTTFDEFSLMLCTYKFDIIALSETEHIINYVNN